MIKFFKKHKLKIFCSFALSFCLSLFGIMAFSNKAYAYSIDNNGNLVGDNLFNINDLQYVDNGHNNFNYDIQNNQLLICNSNGNTFSFAMFKINNLLLTTNTDYTFSFYAYTDYVSAFNKLSLNYEPNVDENYLYCPSQRILSNTYTKYTFNFNSLNYNELYIGIYINTIDTTITNIYIKDIMLNEGTSALEWEPYGVWYSSSNYETLENQLNTTNGLLDLQIDITKYGWLSYIDNLEYYVTGNYVQTFSFNDLKTNNYISNNATLDLYQMSLYQNPNYSYIKFDIFFQNSYANLDYFSANLFDISTKLGFNGVVSIYDTDSNSAVFNIVDIVSITYEDIIEKNSNFGDYIYNVTFEFASPDASTMIYTNSFYTRGYQTGYSYGSNVSTGYYTPIINDLNARISNLENDILSLNNTIDTLKELNAQYQQQLADNVGWSSLFFAFADTPFKVVSNVLGFELFGLNLFATFIGMITVFGVVYLLKKFL